MENFKEIVFRSTNGQKAMSAYIACLLAGSDKYNHKGFWITEAAKYCEDVNTYIELFLLVPVVEDEILKYGKNAVELLNSKSDSPLPDFAIVVVEQASGPHDLFGYTKEHFDKVIKETIKMVISSTDFTETIFNIIKISEDWNEVVSRLYCIKLAAMAMNSENSSKKEIGDIVGMMKALEAIKTITRR